MFEYGYVGALFVLVLCIIDLRDHNKKVEKEWPDNLDPHQWEMRNKFTINMHCFYFLAVVLVAMIIKSIFAII